MRALVVRQPWAEAIASGRKTTEYRCWQTKIRGPILIVAGTFYRAGNSHLPHGRAVAVVEITGCERTANGWAWTLANPRRVVEPFKMRGYQRFFNVDDRVLENANVNLVRENSGENSHSHF